MQYYNNDVKFVRWVKTKFGIKHCKYKRYDKAKNLSYFKC